MMDDIHYGQGRLKDIIKKEATGEDGVDITPQPIEKNT